jgi:hypothetical protein
MVGLMCKSHVSISKDIAARFTGFLRTVSG